MDYHLGKIFISHTEADKPFVRSLADQITKHGFQVWLDERDLIAGDPLAESISQALTTARVVMVIVSATSIKSKWLRYELNLATERMVKGMCRVIPIVIDQTPLPSEVRGLLYADCRDSLENGWPAILTALQHESRRAAFQRGFWSQAEILLKEVFGSIGNGSISGEYFTRDFDVVYLPIQDDDGQEIEVLYEVVSNYLSEPRPLSETWFSEFDHATEEIQIELSLIVTQRPVEFKLGGFHQGNRRIGLRRLQFSDPVITYRQIVVADLTGIKDETEQKYVLGLAREMLIECVNFKTQERQEARARNSQKTGN